MKNPYQQGSLDGLCGVYTAINAAKLISTKMSYEEWQVIFLSIIKHQIDHRKSHTFLVNGLGIARLSKIMRHIIGPVCGATYTRPFKKRRELTLQEFWESLYDFLAIEGKRCVIISFSTKTYGHWTVVKSISHNRLILFDSTERKFINRKHCTTHEITQITPILIDFTATIYLEVK